MNISTLRLSLVAFISTLLLACSGGGGEFFNADEVAFDVSIKAYFADPTLNNPAQDEFALNSCSANKVFSNVGSMNSQYRVSDLRFYLSEPYILLANGAEVPLKLIPSSWQNASVVQIDLEDCNNPATNNSIKGAAFIPSNTEARGLCFNLGLPFGYNHSDFNQAKAPLNVPDLHINRQSGYRFMRLDGMTNPGTSPVNFNVHLGSMGCESSGANIRPSSCTQANMPRVCISNFDFSNDRLVLRLDKLFESTDISLDDASQAAAEKGCMPSQADSTCSTILPKFGLDFIYKPDANINPQIFAKEDISHLIYGYTP